MKKKTILINAIRIFCIVVFSLQFYSLTEDYLQFEVRKDVTNYIANEIEIPEIQILIPYQFALDLNFLRTKYKASFDQVCSKFSDNDECDGYLTNPILFSEWFGGALLLSDIAEHSYSGETFIKKISWSESTEDLLESGKCRLVREASSTFLVLTIRCSDSSGSPLKVSRAKAVIFNSNYLLNFNLNATAMMMKLIYPGKAPVQVTSQRAYETTNQGKQVSLGVHFTKHTELLLANPYKTMCKDYDRLATFEDCLNANSLARTGLLFPGTTIPLNKYSQSSEMRFNSPFDGKNSSLLDIYQKCQSTVTQPMCNSVRYSYTVHGTSQDVEVGKEQMSFFFVVPSQPDSLTQSKPHFRLSDYLILSGSLFSTWFGLSIMGQLLAANHLLCIAYNRKCTNAVDSQTGEIET